MLYLLVLLTALGLLVYCALDVLKTPADQVRTLPKPLWLALIVAFPLIAALPWLLVGRPAPGAAPGGRPSVPRPPVRPVHPDDDDAFLRSLRERAEEQRRRAREQEPPPA